MGGKLAGRVALVTGAGSGIGRASALAFAREGATVVAADIKMDSAEATVATIQSEGGIAHAVGLDVLSAESVAECFAWLDTRGLLADAIVNCAGGARPGDGATHSTTEAVWDNTLDLNLKGTFLVCQAAIVRLLEKGKPGSIINLSARGALNGIGLHAYAAAKGGVAALSKSIGVTYAAKGIRCNALAPGPIDTPMAAWLHDPVKREKGLAGVPMARPGQPEEVAALALYLASNDSSYVTADLIAIDGGASSA